MQFKWHFAPVAVAVLIFAAVNVVPGATARAQSAASKEFTPVVGQEGKDVIWVPTPQSLVERMLQMAKTTSSDYVVDLGSGDGRTVITAAKKYGVRALGIEYNPEMVELSRRNAEKEGVSARATFMKADIFETDFSQATVLTLYLLPSLNMKLRPTILNMKPGTRVVSHAFSMGDWQPDQTDSMEGRTAYLWIVPARVEGTWRWGGARGHELVLRQHFQKIEGLIKADNKLAQFRYASLQGDEIRFSVIDFVGNGTAQRDFVGHVHGDVIEGVSKLPNGGGEEKWTAMRAGG
jgi:hypothetical protein